MKLKKREITLNEVDSVKDAYFLQRAIVREYENSPRFAARKETENVIETLRREGAEEEERLLKLLQKIKENRL